VAGPRGQKLMSDYTYKFCGGISNPGVGPKSYAYIYRDEVSESTRSWILAHLMSLVEYFCDGLGRNVV
jgi:hypothetical protein